MDDEYNHDPLFLALTRPASLGGIPLEAFMASSGIAGLAMIFADSVFYLLVFVPLWAISKIIVQRDQNAFRIIHRFLETSARCMNRLHWGGSSSSPMLLRRRYVYREFRQ